MKKEDIKGILELQELDQEIARVQRRLGDVRREIEELTDEFNGLKGELDKLLSALDDLRSERKRLKEEIEREEHMLAKTEEKMLRVRKDIEYKALLREKSKHEDNILKKSYELDSLEGRIKELSDLLNRRRPRIEKRLKEIEEEINDLKMEEKIALGKLKELNKIKLEKEKNLSDDVLTFYREAREKFEDRIVVQVEEGVCMGCGIKIPDVLFSKLIREDTIENCPSCGRYIYYTL